MNITNTNNFSPLHPILSPHPPPPSFPPQHDKSQKVMRLAQDILENYIGVVSDDEEPAGPGEFSFPRNPGPQDYNFDAGM
jgi:hypothetical protein